MDDSSTSGGLKSLSSVALWPFLMNLPFLAQFLPWEGIASQLDVTSLVQAVLRTSIGYYLSGILLCFGLVHLLYTIWKLARAAVLATWQVKCSIPQESDHQRRVMAWVSKHPETQSRTSLKVKDADEDPDDNTGSREVGVDFSDGQDSLQMKRLTQINGPLFSPDITKVQFWYRGAYFWFTESTGTKRSRWGDQVPDNYLDLHSFTWNRSQQQIKDFLTMINAEQASKTTLNTIVWGPYKNEYRYRSGGFAWTVNRIRKKRPLRTVVMGRLQMETILNDVRTFLSRPGVEWYKEKGLPLRLGYLFYGPPGTGKSSFAFALAGHFGVPIYMLNVSLPDLTDAGVEGLFSKLPFHCIIMLEDIDATKPMKRVEEPKEEEVSSPKPKDSDESGSQDASAGDLPASPKPTKRKNDVTLSGLLNAIDGIGAAEGRILIMSTNKLEDLDEALIRTGRADRIVEFTNTTKDQARDMFISAYTGVRWTEHRPAGRGQVAPLHESEDWTDQDIALLAGEFSDKIRDQAFSPALIQQFFKDFRAQPRRAVRELDEWMKDPRAYRKPVQLGRLQVSDGASARAGSPTPSSGTSASLGASETSSAIEDLMSLDDLGGYQEPACFDPEAEANDAGLYGPLLDAS